MKSAVLIFPGSNCDRDVAVALQRWTGVSPVRVWHKDTSLPSGIDLIVVPGGFSYGDYLRCGALAARSPVMREVCRLARHGVRVLGICNGFQILTEAGLLPGVLLRNASLKFICRDVFLRVETNESPFTREYQARDVVRFPVAHHDGNFYAEPDILDRLEHEGRIAFRYCARDGAVTQAANINGSQHNIAGVFNESRTILGLMPHPERLADPHVGCIDGGRLFESLLAGGGS